MVLLNLNIRKLSIREEEYFQKREQYEIKSSKLERTEES